jgi:hypothetical protein
MALQELQDPTYAAEELDQFLESMESSRRGSAESNQSAQAREAFSLMDQCSADLEAFDKFQKEAESEAQAACRASWTASQESQASPPVETSPLTHVHKEREKVLTQAMSKENLAEAKLEWYETQRIKKKSAKLDPPPTLPEILRVKNKVRAKRHKVYIRNFLKEQNKKKCKQQWLPTPFGHVC